MVDIAHVEDFLSHHPSRKEFFQHELQWRYCGRGILHYDDISEKHASEHLPPRDVAMGLRLK